MYISKKYLVLGLVVLLGLALSGPLFADDPTLAKSSTLETILSRGELQVLSDIPFPPFEFFDDNGNLVGFDIDLVQLMADELGVKLNVIKAGSFDTIRTELNNGDADIIASDMTATLARAREVNFTAGYLETGQIALVSKKKSPGKDAQTYADLNVSGAVITVQTGTTGEDAAMTFFPNAQIKSFTTSLAALQEVLDGKADAILFDDVFLIPNFTDPATTFICCPVVDQPGPIDTLRKTVQPVSLDVIALAIRKGDPDFLTWVNLFVEQTRSVIVVTDELAQKFNLPASAVGNPILPELQKKWKLRS